MAVELLWGIPDTSANETYLTISNESIRPIVYHSKPWPAGLMCRSYLFSKLHSADRSWPPSGDTEGIMISFGKTLIIEEDCRNEEQKGLYDLWSRLPKSDKVVCMDYVSCVLQVKVACEFIEAWLEQWNKDFEGVPVPSAVDAAHRPLEGECTTSSPNLLRPVSNENGHDPRFSQVLSQAVIECVQCHLFADVLMEAIHKKISRVARRLGYYYSGQNQEFMEYSEKCLSKWSLPESEGWDPDFQCDLLDATRCSVEEHSEVSEPTESKTSFWILPERAVTYVKDLFRRSANYFGRLLLWKSK